MRRHDWLPLLAACLICAPTMAGAQIQRTVNDDGVISFSNENSVPQPARSKSRKRKAESAPTVVMPSDDSPGRLSRYDQHIREAASLYKLPEELVRAVIQVESNYDPRAVSPAGAHGLMQLMPFTAERMMVSDIFDPRQNIMGGTRYLRILANMFNGDLKLTVAAYNAGENAVIRYGGIPPYQETQMYVVKVLENYQRYRKKSSLSGSN